jgi:glutaredoxin
MAVSVGVSEGLSWWSQERAADTVRQHAKAGDITMYSTTTCPYCAKARDWLNGHAIPWRECNVDQDKACLQVYDTQGAPGTPLMSVKGRWHLGFDAGWLGEALQLNAAVKPGQP